MMDLENPALTRLGCWSTQGVHGNKRDEAGNLLTPDVIMNADVERDIGIAYLGIAAGVMVFLAIMLYAAVTGNHGKWSQIGPEMIVLIPLAFIAHLGGMVSGFWAVMLWCSLPRRDDV